MARIVERISLEDVRRARPAMIYYAARTTWWTHDPAHLSKLPGSGLPCDPRGSVLFQTDRPEEFLANAERNPEHYGRHGLRAFMAAHHLNCQLSETDPRPWSLETWDEVNDALDRADAGG